MSIVRVPRQRRLNNYEKRKTLKPKVISIAKYQTGTRKSKKKDNEIQAMPPGKRRSKYGRVYYECRRNKTDIKGTKL